MKHLLALILISFSYFTYGQIRYTGSIETPMKDTLIGGQFGIYSTDDTTFLKGDLIENNNFEFNHSKKPFFIKIFSVAHKDSFILITPKPAQGKYNIGTIKLVSKEDLDQVTVRASRPMFKRSLKGMKVNVANTPLSELENLFDVLKASPKVMSPDDESLQIIGKGTPKIFVDRQEIMSMDELKAIPATFVDKIDIITNPSARYSAEGAGGVIEVYTMNYHMEGSVTSVGLNGGVNIVGQPKLGGNVNFNYKKGKFSLNLSANGSYGRYKSPSSSRVEYTDSSGIVTNSQSTGYGGHFWGYGNLKMKYNINKKHSLTAGLRGWGGGNDGKNDAESEFYQHSVLEQNSSSNSINGNIYVTPTAHLNYKWLTDSSGSYFTTRFQYNISIRDGFTEDNSNYNNIPAQFTSNFRRRTSSEDRPNVFTTFLDYVHILDTTGWEFAVGGYHSGLINGKIYNQFNFIDEQWQKDEQFSNAYDYDEHVAALYFDFEKEWKAFSLKLGVRGEGTFIKGFSKALNQTIIDSSYFLLFPSTTMMFNLSKKWTMTMSYNPRIERPQFENFDPFIRQSDSTNITYGNPNLLPAYSHTASLEFGYGYGYSLEISYSRTNNPISNRSFMDSLTFINHSTPANASFSDKIGLDLSIPINLKWWRGYNSLWTSYQKFYFPENFQRNPFSNLSFGLYLYEQFFLPKDWSINTSLNVSAYGDAESISNPNYYWNVGLAKKMLDGDLNIRFDINNIIPPQFRRESYGANYIIYSNSQWAFTSFKIGIRYKFGRLKAVSHIEDAKKGGQSDRL